METVLVEVGQVPLPMLHIKIFVPVFKLFTEEVAEFGAVKIPLPETTVQVPVPTVGIFALRVEVEEQMVVFVPALATLGFASTLIETVLVEVGQVPLPTLHIKVFVPTSKPVTLDVAVLTEVALPPPETKVQVPVPTVGMVALKVEVEEQIV